MLLQASRLCFFSPSPPLELVCSSDSMHSTLTAIYPLEHNWYYSGKKTKTDATRQPTCLIWKVHRIEAVIKTTVGSCFKGKTISSGLFCTEVVWGYREREQFWAPSCSSFLFFFFFVHKRTDKIFLCDLEEWKVSVSKRVQCCVCYYLAGSPATQRWWRFNLASVLTRVPDSVFPRITRGREEERGKKIDLGSWAASSLVNTEPHKYFILFFLCCITCSGKHFMEE